MKKIQHLYPSILKMCESGYTIYKSCRYHNIATSDLYRYMDPIQRQKLYWAKALSKKHTSVPKGPVIERTIIVSTAYAHF